MQAVASGDKAAQAALIARILPSVLGRARGLCRAPADADDAAQEALLEILRSARSFSGRGSLQGWCDRITVRTTLRRQRRELRKLVLLDSACDLEQLPARGREIPLREAVPGELQDYLAELSADRYEALCLWAKGHAIDEIAEHTGASPNTIKDRLRMARKQVRRAIRQREVLGELARARTQTKEGERA
nr:RNA polymerase sigma factor [Pseudenhygromyxa sp. WMMC2535]